MHSSLSKERRRTFGLSGQKPRSFSQISLRNKYGAGNNFGRRCGSHASQYSRLITSKYSKTKTRPHSNDSSVLKPVNTLSGSVLKITRSKSRRLLRNCELRTQKPKNGKPKSHSKRTANEQSRQGRNRLDLSRKGSLKELWASRRATSRPLKQLSSVRPRTDLQREERTGVRRRSSSRPKLTGDQGRNQACQVVKSKSDRAIGLVTLIQNN